MINLNLLPSNWKIITLGEISSLIQYGLNASAEQQGEGFLYLRISDINDDGSVKLANPKYLSSKKQYVSKYILKSGDIVIARSGSVGRSFVYQSSNDPWVFASYLIRFRIRQDLAEPDYVGLFMRSPYYRRYIDKMSRSVAQTNINSKELSKLPIPLPSLPEQRRIVTILHEADEIRCLRKLANEKRKKFLQSVFFELFGNPDPKRNDRGWEIVKLGDFLEVGTGGTPSRSNPSYYGGSYAWVKTTELRDNIITSTEETITATGLKFSNAKIYPENTILLAMYGQGQTRGRTAKLGIPAATNQACAAFLPSHELLPNYLWYWFHNSYENVRNLARGGPQANLNLSILKNLKIPKPDLNLQQKFETLVDEYLQLEALSTTSFDKTDSLFKSLLSNAFTGELTAAWREQHQAQLAAAECDQLLQISQPVDTEELADEEASETKSSELHRDRDKLLRNLSKSQRKIYESVIQETAYFTPERLEEKYSISLNIGQKGLQLLAAAGLIVPVTLPTPTSSGLRYELAYRNLKQDDACYSDVALLTKDIV